MKEIRKISINNLRRICIEYDFYICGDCEKYSKILCYANELENITTDELETIATDIKNHSDTDYEVKEIMFILANECCVTFIE